MGRPKYIIVVREGGPTRPSTSHHSAEYYAHEHPEHTEHNLPYEHFANTLMNDKGFIAYVHKHGYHFTEALAEHLSKMMENADGSKHFWSAEQVKKAMVGLGFFQFSDKNMTKTKSTYGDLTYLANMLYADLYPDPFKDEASCLKGAWKVANDPDGYDGMVFSRWTADAIGKGIQIDWLKFV